MVITSDGVDKLVSKFNRDIEILFDNMANRGTYVAAVIEDEKALAPEFDYAATLAEIDKLQNKIIILKHARNLFNNETEVKEGMTVDQALVRMAMLVRRKDTYARMAKRMPKERVNTRIGGGKEIEYTYTNYDISEAKKRSDEVEAEILELRQLLNVVNSTKTFEVDIEE